MHIASVICDLCGTPAPLENFNGVANYRMPQGWVSIGSHVTIHGDLRDKSEKKWEFKERLKEMLPKYHLCPDCTADKVKIEALRKEQEAEASKIRQLTEPPRRVFNLEGQ